MAMFGMGKPSRWGEIGAYDFGNSARTAAPGQPQQMQGMSKMQAMGADPNAQANASAIAASRPQPPGGSFVGAAPGQPGNPMYGPNGLFGAQPPTPQGDAMRMQPAGPQADSPQAAPAPGQPGNPMYGPNGLFGQQPPTPAQPQPDMMREAKPDTGGDLYSATPAAPAPDPFGWRQQMKPTMGGGDARTAMPIAGPAGTPAREMKPMIGGSDSRMGSPMPSPMQPQQPMMQGGPARPMPDPFGWRQASPMPRQATPMPAQPSPMPQQPAQQMPNQMRGFFGRR